MANLPHQERFAGNLKALIPVIKAIVGRACNSGLKFVDPQLLDVAGGLLNGFNTTTMIEKFIERSNPFWERIRNKENSFFVENAGLVFDGLQVDIVNSFKMLYESKHADGTPVLTPKDEKLLWEYFHSMVKISIKYIHSTRRTNPTYSSEISLEDLIRKWDVKV